MEFHRTEDIINDIRDGRMVILMDDEDRENEGDLVMAAQYVTPQHVNFMAMHARGLICMPVSSQQAERLGLRLMVQRNDSGFGTKFTTSIEAASGVTTGISAADRAHTMQVAASPTARPESIVQPGHVFPLIAEPGGVLVRAGHTEASCDLCRLAGLNEAAVICEIMNDDGTMAEREDLFVFAKKHDLKIGTIADLIQYKAINETTIEKLDMFPVQTDYGAFSLHTYRDLINGGVHLALTKGELDRSPTLVRVQHCVSLRDVLTVQSADGSGWNIARCLQRIEEEGKGVLVLLSGTEEPAAILDKVSALREAGTRPVRNPQSAPLMIGVGSQILQELGLGEMRLMARPAKYHGISGFNLFVHEYVRP